MSEKIINRVANSKLVTIDLDDFYPKGERVSFDISPWLTEGIILREKEFRDKAENHKWLKYKDCFVALHCSTDAIIPGWAYLLLTIHLAPFAKKVIVGNLEKLENTLFAEIIKDLDVSGYVDKPVIIKGCSRKEIPENACILLAQRLYPVARSIMYGEACSSVPLYKRKRS